MSQRLDVRPFEESDVAAAAELMAERHRRELDRFPLLPPRFGDAGECREMLRAVTGYAEPGMAATLEGTLVGFLFGISILQAPESPSARYGSPRSTMMFAHGHAAAPEHADAAYQALYAVLAGRWVGQGFFEHVAHVPAGGSAAVEAWANLGFGRAHAVAIRDTRAAPDEAGLADVRRATPDDIESVIRLVDEESRFHATSPIFRPYVGRDTAPAVRESLRAALADEDQALFIARCERQDAGIISIGPGRGSPLYIPDNGAYIGDTAVREEFRDAGLGRALLAAALGWARQHDYQAVTLHYAAANALSRSFWTGQGFVPVMWHLRRHVDSRMAWARPD